MRSIEELLQDNIDRSDMTEEEEYAFVEYWFKKYAEGGFCETFQSPFDIPDKDKPYVGKPFKVICECDTETVDLECLPMWGIEFEDGHIMNAYPEEICLIEQKNDTSETNINTGAGIITTQVFDDEGFSKGVLVRLNGELVCMVDVDAKTGKTRVFAYTENEDKPSDCIIVRQANPNVLEARLLSVDEALSLPDEMKIFDFAMLRAERGGEWWLQGCGPSHEGYAYSVTRAGKIQFSCVDELKYIRPALKIDIRGTRFKIGDTFMFGGKEFKILSPELAWMYKECLGYSAFCNHCYGRMANFYSNSVIKGIVDEWFAKALLAEKVKTI